jgi:glycosyltransferase involved in cell wall biosynthesis
MTHAIVVIPVYNATSTLRRCIMSALRQRDVRITIIAVDHGSTDGSADMVRGISAVHQQVRLIRLTRAADERRSPSRPLNVGVDAALGIDEEPTDTWIYRLDTDDVLCSDTCIATQLARGGRAGLITSTLVFFDKRKRLAFEYGVLVGPEDAAAKRLDLVSVAHHASAMRADLLATVRSAWGACYDERLVYAEDVGLTVKLVQSARADGCQAVPEPLCYKELSRTTLTESIPMVDVMRSYRNIRRQHPLLGHRYAARDLWELGAGRVVGATIARRLARGRLGFAGHPSRYPFAAVAQRLCDLETDWTGVRADGGVSDG